MLFSEGGAAEGPVVYYHPEAELGRPDTTDPGEAEILLREAIVDSVRHHLVADVPVGAFLSGGVDSSALVGLLARNHDGPIRTVTLSFDVPALDEGDLAAQAARLYGSDHHEIKMGIDEVRERIPDAIRALDQPSIDGINTYFVSEAAVKVGLKVAVSGIGGDELFGGYGTFSRVPKVRAIHDRMTSLPGGGGLVRVATRLLHSLPRTREGEKLARLLEYGGSDAGAYFAERGLFSQHEVRDLLAPSVREAADACDPRGELETRIRLNDLPPEERVSALEMRQYLQVQLLRDSDATSMRHSLELRTPLVDRDLLRAVARVPAALRRAGPAKRFLRDAPMPPVPPALWQRRKQGFTLPFEHWLRTGGIKMRLPNHPWLVPQAVQRVADDFRRGRVHWSRVWALVVLEQLLA